MGNTKDKDNTNIVPKFQKGKYQHDEIMKWQVHVLVNKVDPDIEAMRRNTISHNTSFCKITRLWIKVTAASNTLLEICDLTVSVTEENGIV